MAKKTSKTETTAKTPCKKSRSAQRTRYSIAVLVKYDYHPDSIYKNKTITDSAIEKAQVIKEAIKQLEQKNNFKNVKVEAGKAEVGINHEDTRSDKELTIDLGTVLKAPTSESSNKNQTFSSAVITISAGSLQSSNIKDVLLGALKTNNKTALNNDVPKFVKNLKIMDYHIFDTDVDVQTEGVSSLKMIKEKKATINVKNLNKNQISELITKSYTSNCHQRSAGKLNTNRLPIVNGDAEHPTKATAKKLEKILGKSPEKTSNKTTVKTPCKKTRSERCR